MSRKFGRLPPLSAIEGFEAAARLKSFSLAAEELSITQSAVSHQIRALEEFFGLALFNRVGRSVEPTVAGLDFLETASEMLEILARGQRRLSFYHRPGSVVIGTSSAFARNWLLPRYDALKEAVPGVQPWLYTSDDGYDLDTQDVDLAIWYGDGHWAGLESIELFNDSLTPMYAPDKFPDHPSITNVEQLLEFPLLHDERPDDWLVWFRKIEYSGPNSVDGSVYSDPSLLLEAARSGQGVALGSRILAASLIDSGELVCPFNESIKTSDGYYMTYDGNQPLRKEVGLTKEWLLKEVADCKGLLNL